MLEADTSQNFNHLTYSTMHYRFFVTFNKEHAAASTEARDYAAQYLNNNGFSYDEHDEDKRWARGFADWFVIGGRWSGELSRHSWAASLYTRMENAEKAAGVQVWGASYTDKTLQRKQKALAKLFTVAWKQEAPKAYRAIPINRNTYKGDGYEDDAMPLTQELYDELLQEYEAEQSGDSEHHADLDYDAVSSDMIGKKWLVVVDYHT